MLRAALPLGGARLATESRIKRQYLLATVLVLGLVARGAEGQNQTNCSNLVGSGGSGGVSGEQCSLAAGGNCGCSGRLAAAPLVGVCPSALAGGALGVANLATNATDAFTVNGTIVAPVNLSGAALRAVVVAAFTGTVGGTLGGSIEGSFSSTHEPGCWTAGGTCVAQIEYTLHANVQPALALLVAVSVASSLANVSSLAMALDGSLVTQTSVSLSIRSAGSIASVKGEHLSRLCQQAQATVAANPPCWRVESVWDASGSAKGISGLQYDSSGGALGLDNSVCALGQLALPAPSALAPIELQWDGTTCPVHPCGTVPCRNGAFCNTSNASTASPFVCQCATGFQGERCENRIPRYLSTAMSSFSGAGSAGGLVGARSSFVLYARDQFGEPFIPATGETPFRVAVAKTGGGDEKAGMVQVAQAGREFTHVAEYILEIQHSHTLSVTAPWGGHVAGSPRTITAVSSAGDIHLNSSIATGAGLTVATAGIEARFSVHFTDVYGIPVQLNSNAPANVSVSITSDTAQASVDVSLSSTETGVVSVTYTPEEAGEFSVTVHVFGGALLAGSFSLTVVAASASAAESVVLFEAAPTVGSVSAFDIIPRDRFGNPIRLTQDSGPSSCDSIFAASLGGSSYAAGTMTSNGACPAVCRGSFTPLTTGAHNLTVTLKSSSPTVALASSPFAVSVVAGPATVHNSTATVTPVLEAGQNLSIVVIPKDAFGYVSVLPQGRVAVSGPQSVADVELNATAGIMLQQAGIYTVSIFYGDQELAQNPFRVQVIANAAAVSSLVITVAGGLASSANISVGEQQELTLTPTDNFGNGFVQTDISAASFAVLSQNLASYLSMVPSYLNMDGSWSRAASFCGHNEYPVLNYPCVANHLSLDGTFKLRYAVQMPGAYVLNVSLTGTNTVTNNGTFSILASAVDEVSPLRSYTVFTGMNDVTSSETTAGIAVPFNVQLLDAYNNTLSTVFTNRFGSPSNQSIDASWSGLDMALNYSNSDLLIRIRTTDVVTRTTIYTPLAAEHVGQGQFNASFSPTLSGDYRVDVTYAGKPLVNAPLALTVVPSAVVSEASQLIPSPGGAGVVGTTQYLTLVAKDQYGNMQSSNTPDENFSVAINISQSSITLSNCSLFLASSNETTCYGCSDPAAANYDPAANVYNNSCIYTVLPFLRKFSCPAVDQILSGNNLYVNGRIWLGPSTSPSISSAEECAQLCMQTSTCQSIDYSSNAERCYLNDGLKDIDGLLVHSEGYSYYELVVSSAQTACTYGCTNPVAANYNSAANQSDGTCYDPAGVNVSRAGDGTYRVMYAVELDGTYTINVSHIGNPVGGHEVNVAQSAGVVDAAASNIGTLVRHPVEIYDVAGVDTFFAVELRDSAGVLVPNGVAEFGVTLINLLNRSDTVVQNVSVTPTGRLGYRLNQSGTYMVNVSMNGQPMDSMTRLVLPGPVYAPNCIVSGISNGPVGVTHQVSVQLRDYFNNLIADTALGMTSGVVIRVEPSQASASLGAVANSYPAYPVDTSPGVYATQYILSIGGQYSISVTVNGANVGAAIPTLVYPAHVHSIIVPTSWTGVVAKVEPLPVFTKDAFGNEHKDFDTAVLDANGMLATVSYNITQASTGLIQPTVGNASGLAFGGLFTVPLQHLEVAGRYTINGSIGGVALNVAFTLTAGDANHTTSSTVDISDAVAGVQDSNLVVTRDRFNNSCTKGGESIFAQFSGTNLPFIGTTILDRGDGTYALSYVGRSAGPYALNILMYGSNLVGSPFALHVFAAAVSAPHCTVSGTALNATAVAGQMLSVDVYPADAFGNPVNVSIPHQFSFAVMASAGAVAAGWLDQASSTILSWSGTFGVFSAKNHTVSAYYRGTSILAQPHAIRILAAAVSPANTQVWTGSPSISQAAHLSGVQQMIPSLSCVAGFDIKLASMALDIYGNRVFDDVSLSGLNIPCVTVGNFFHQVSVVNVLLQNISVTVTPGPAVASTASGAGLTSAIAGEYASFEITCTDKFGNIQPRSDLDVAVSITSVDLYPVVSITPQVTHPGSVFLVRYISVRGGQYWISISLDDKSTTGTPVRTTIMADWITDTSKSFVTGGGALGALVNRTESFSIIRKDGHGNVRRLLNDIIYVSMAASSAGISCNSNANVTDTAQCNVNVTASWELGYMVHYIVPVAAVYTIEVTVGSEAISNTPFSIQATLDPGLLDATRTTVKVSASQAIAGQLLTQIIEPRSSTGVLLSMPPSTTNVTNTTSCLSALATMNGTCGPSYMSNANISTVLKATQQCLLGTVDWNGLQQVSNACLQEYYTDNQRFQILASSLNASQPVINNGDGTFTTVSRPVVSQLTSFSVTVQALSHNSTYTITQPHFIWPAAVDAKNSTLVSALDPAVAGTRKIVSVQTADEYGNELAVGSNVSVNLELYLGALQQYDVNSTAFDRGDGKLDAGFMATLAGSYTLHILIDGIGIKGSPFDLTVQPAALDVTKSTCTGSGLDVAVAGIPASLHVVGRDIYGNAFVSDNSNLTSHASLLLVRLSFEGVQVLTSGFVVSNTSEPNSTFSSTYTLTQARRYTLHVLVGTEIILETAIPCVAGSVDATKSMLFGLSQSYSAGQHASLALATKDSFGNQIAAQLGSAVSVGCVNVDASVNCSTLAIARTLSADGNLSITVRSTASQSPAGRVNITVQIGSTDVAGSPMAVTWDLAAPPSMSSAKVTPDGKGVVVTFDKATDRANIVGDLSCSDVFAMDTVNRFGGGHGCFWTDDSTLLVRLGHPVPGQTVSLLSNTRSTLAVKPGAIGVLGADSAKCSGSVSLQASDTAAKIQAAVSLPTVVGACDAAIVVDCSRSVNTAVGMSSFQFSVIGSPNAFDDYTCDDAAVTTDLSSGYTYCNRATIKASSLTLDREYTVVVVAKNEYGQTSTHTSVVKRSAAAVPTVRIVGPSSRVADCSSVLSIEADVKLPKGPSCTGLLTIIAYSWNQTSTGPTISLGTSAQHRRLYVTPESLIPGQLYTLQLTVTAVGWGSSYSGRGLVSVRVPTRSIVASIIGGNRQVSSNNQSTLVLDGRAQLGSSTDRCVGESSPTSMLYRWSCRTLLGGTSCFVGENSYGADETFSEELNTSRSVLTISTGIIKAETLLFQLTVTTATSPVRQGTSSARITVVGTDLFPQVSIAIPTGTFGSADSESVGKVSVANGIVLRPAVAQISATAAVAYLWSIEPNVSVPVPMMGDFLVLPENTLSSGSLYTFRLTVTETGVETTGVTSIVLRANDLPSGGIVQACRTPFNVTVGCTSSGTFMDPFEITFSSWTDSDLPLTYSLSIDTTGRNLVPKTLHTKLNDVRIPATGTVILGADIFDAYGSSVHQTIALALGAGSYGLVDVRRDFDTAKGSEDSALLCRTIAGFRLSSSSGTRRMLQSSSSLSSNQSVLYDEIIAELESLLAPSTPTPLLAELPLLVTAVGDLAAMNVTHSAVSLPRLNVVFSRIGAVARQLSGLAHGHVKSAVETADSLSVLLQNTLSSAAFATAASTLRASVGDFVLSALQARETGEAAVSLGSSNSTNSATTFRFVRFDQSSVLGVAADMSVEGLDAASVPSNVEFGLVRMEWLPSYFSISSSSTLFSSVVSFSVYNLSASTADIRALDVPINATIKTTAIQVQSGYYGGCWLFNSTIGFATSGITTGPSSANSTTCLLSSLGSFSAFGLFEQPWQQCIEGQQWQVSAPTTYMDRVCTAISAPCHYNATEVAAPTNVSDRICSCTNNTYGSGQQCEPWTVCNSSLAYQSSSPTSTQNRVCTQISQCSTAQYELTGPNASSDRTCAAMTVCGPGQYETNAVANGTLRTTDRECANLTSCISSQFEVNPLCGQGTPDNCWNRDRVCQCSAGSFLTGNASAPSCTAWTNCSVQGTRYEIVAPNSTDDAVCQSLTTCSPPSNWQVVAPTHTTDRVCSCGPIPSTTGLWMNLTMRSCHNVTVCTNGSQFQTASPTLTSDRACQDYSVCSTSTQYESQAGTNISDRVCTSISSCDPHATEVEPPTPYSDRTCTCTVGSIFGWGNGYSCAPYSNCSANAALSANGTSTSDRVCGCVGEYWGDGYSCYPWRQCGANATDTGPSPNNTHDRQCTCNSSWYALSGQMNAIVHQCRQWTVCQNNSHAIVNPSATVDRVCQCNSGYWTNSVNQCTPWTVCPSSSYLEEAQAPNLTTDRTCQCADGYWRPTANNQCTPWTACSQWQTITTNGSRISDQSCGCASEWEPATADAPSNCQGGVCPSGCAANINFGKAQGCNQTSKTCVCACGFSGSSCQIPVENSAMACNGAVLQITLNRDIDGLTLGTSSRTAFIASFTSDVAAAAGCTQARVSVQNIRPGSIVVKFAIAVSADSTQPAVATAVASLTSWLAEPGQSRSLGGAAVLTNLSVVQQAPNEQPEFFVAAEDEEKLTSIELLAGSLAGLVLLAALIIGVQRVLHNRIQSSKMEQQHLTRYEGGVAKPVMRATDDPYGAVADTGIEGVDNQQIMPDVIALDFGDGQQQQGEQGQQEQHREQQQQPDQDQDQEQPPSADSSQLHLRLRFSHGGTDRDVDIQSSVTGQMLLAHLAEQQLCAPGSELHYMGHCLNVELPLSSYGLSNGAVLMIHPAAHAQPEPQPAPEEAPTSDGMPPQSMQSTVPSVATSGWRDSNGTASGLRNIAAQLGSNHVGNISTAKAAARKMRNAHAEQSGFTTEALRLAKAEHGPDWANLTTAAKQSAVLDASVRMERNRSSVGNTSPPSQRPTTPEPRRRPSQQQQGHPPAMPESSTMVGGGGAAATALRARFAAVQNFKGSSRMAQQQAPPLQQADYAHLLQPPRTGNAAHMGSAVMPVLGALNAFSGHAGPSVYDTSPATKRAGGAVLLPRDYGNRAQQYEPMGQGGYTAPSQYP